MKRLSMLLLLALAACSDADTARRVLEQNGYEVLEVGGHALFSCGKDDDFATQFKAKSPGGQIVSGAVCSGWFKGATIRFD
jgi:hypothetical protein